MASATPQRAFDLSYLSHWLPDGVRTNGVFAEVPQYTIIMTYLWHNYGIIMGIYGTSIKTTFVLTPSGSR